MPEIVEKLKNTSADFRKVIVGVCLFIFALPLGFIVLKNAVYRADILRTKNMGDIVNPAPQSDENYILQEELADILAQMASSTQSTSTATTSEF